MLPRANVSLRQPTLYARRRPPARSAVVPLEKAHSSSLNWEARAKAQRIVTSSFSVRVGATVPPKSGCVRYWKACGPVSVYELKKEVAVALDRLNKMQQELDAHQQNENLQQQISAEREHLQAIEHQLDQISSGGQAAT